MNAVQLDEAINSKKLVTACENEAKVDIVRFPPEMRDRGLKDPEVIAQLMPLGNTFLTTDLGFARDWAEYIPDGQPGIGNERGREPARGSDGMRSLLPGPGPPSRG